MALEKTKQILERLHDKFGEDLMHAKRDIRPDESQLSASGYSYYGIEENDKNFIYSAISSLGILVNDANGAIVFDIDGFFVTEKKALVALKEVKSFVEANLNGLVLIKEKYEGKDFSEYPIEVCYGYHYEINSILDEILLSEEVTQFERPTAYSDAEKELTSVRKQNDDLRFNAFWLKRRWAYILHLAAFFPFIIICIVLLYHKETKDLLGVSNLAVLIVSGLITILFNLLFNNHSSFKDAWKILTKNGRRKLVEKEKNDFIKSAIAR